VATVNADLRVGTLQETITVTGETLIVDVRMAVEFFNIDTGTYTVTFTMAGFNTVKQNGLNVVDPFNGGGGVAERHRQEPRQPDQRFSRSTTSGAIGTAGIA